LRIKYTKKKRFIVIQNFVIIQKKKKKRAKIRKKRERWGQNKIKKRWDYKYPFLLSSMTGIIVKIELVVKNKWF